MIEAMKMLYIGVIALIAGIVLPAIVVVTAPASRAEANPPSVAPTTVAAGTMRSNAPAKACPMCPAAGVAGTAMDMPPAMKQRCDMVMNAELSKNDAQCLLGLNQEITLTPEQVQQLEHIVNESRLKAAAALTPDQQRYLADRPAEAMSMNGMHMNIHRSMMQRPETAGKTPKSKPVDQQKGAATSGK